MSLIASWHPTFAFWHNPYELGAFLTDLDRYARMLKGQLEAPPRRLEIKPLAKNVKRLHAWALRTGRPLAIDIETIPETKEEPWTGKDPTRARLQLMGIGNRVEALSHRWTDGKRKIEKAIKHLLADERVVKILQNGDWFDLRVLIRYGVVCRNVHDTRDARRAVSSTSPLRLSHLASLYTDYEPWKEGETGDEKGLVFTRDLPKKKRYNGHDCVVTARSWHGITKEPEWKEKRVQRLYSLHRDLARIAAEMHTTGIRVDKRMRRWMAWALAQEYREKEKLLLRKVNLKGFDCQPNHLRALIYKKHATGKYATLGRFQLPDPIDPAMYVDKKEMTTISVKEEPLTLLLIDPDVPQELKEIIQLYWDAQEIWKRRSTFVVSKRISHAIGPDGRIRPGWNSCGTDTGRFSCADPNLMNVEKLLRAMYIADRGCILVGGDYSQLELRVNYAITDDEVLGDGLRKDVYTEDAKEFFNLPGHITKKTIKKEARKTAKIIHLGRQYAAGKKTTFLTGLKQDRSLQWDAVSLLCDAFDKRYSRRVEWWGEEMNRVIACGYSESRILQRRRVYPRPPAITDTSNFPIQATASDVKNLALVALDAGLKKHKMKSRIILDLHDAIYMNSPKSEARQAQELLKDCMEVSYEIQGKKVTFPSVIEAQERWSEFD